VPDVVDPLGRLLDLANPIVGADRTSLALAVSRAFRGIFEMTALMGLVTLVLALMLPRGVGAGFSRRT
jgi:hypothetical protein